MFITLVLVAPVYLLEWRICYTLYFRKENSGKIFSLEYASQSEITSHKLKNVINSFRKMYSDTGSAGNACLTKPDYWKH